MTKKLLILYGPLLHYRISLFNELCKNYNVTVIATSYTGVKTGLKFNLIIRRPWKLWRFQLQSGICAELKRGSYDCCVVFLDITYLSYMSILLFSRKYKTIAWGAWVTDSFLANRLRLFLIKKADASIFYTYSSMHDFIKKGIDSKKLYVANNTFDVGERIKAYENKNKTRILFVGSLDKRKQNDILIKAFSNILNKIPNNILLTIIGDGAEFDKLTAMTNRLQLNHRVVFLGRINDPKDLKKYYAESFLSVSFGQAGLSVLQALGFGVPFLTKKNAISGGEITNIKHMINGILCEDNLNSLEENLIFAVNHLKQMILMGENAYNYYSEYCTIENYTVGFKDAIEGTRNAKVDTSNP